jgi:LysM repeat protein
VARRPTRVILLSLVLAAALGAAIGALSQLTAVDAVDPRTGNLPPATPTPVPTPTASPSPTQTAVPTPTQGGNVWLYTIAAGDSISELAIRFGTTTSELLALNPEYAGNQDLVEVGGTMIMPCTPIAVEEDRC